MSVVSMKALLESGVHFGHRTHKWNPFMKPYIFTERNGIHIINLQLTVKALEEGYEMARETASNGGTILFVGTKRQAQETIQNEATRAGMPYVTARWLGGFLTNWRTIKERINELERLERMRDRGDFERVTKREALNMTRQIEKLEMRLGGIRNMVNLPDMLFVVDVRREETAIHEANLLNIPVIAMVDTNCDPREVDYVIPSNDDAIRAIKLVVGKMADAVLEGKALRKDEEQEEGELREAAAKAKTDEFAVVDEPQLTDEDLLGAATLAKMRTEEEVEEPEVAAEAAVADETAEAPPAEEPEEDAAETDDDDDDDDDDDEYDDYEGEDDEDEDDGDDDEDEDDDDYDDDDED